MSINIDNVFGIHERALILKAKRSEILSSNLANADTPHYKARDIDFRSVLTQAKQQQDHRLSTTHARHINTSGQSVQSELLYRVPEQTSLDGNTVDSRVEQAKFAENSLLYQTTLAFLNSRISGLRGAIRGE